SSVLLPSGFLGGITGQFFKQFALTISVSMLISAVNAMTMTPARAAWIFSGRRPPHPTLSPRGGEGRVRGPGGHGDGGKEALPWWFFGLLGGVATVWLLTPVLGPRLGLPVGEEAAAAGEGPGGIQASLLTWGTYLALFLPGAVAGGALGWYLIRPVNWA